MNARRLVTAFTCRARRFPVQVAEHLSDRGSHHRADLPHLAGRCRCLQDSTQADIDAWYATATGPDATRTFLKCAIASRAMPRLDVPARRHAERAPISQHRRLALIHRFPTDKRIELRTRVAGCLLLLYAQPVSRRPA